MQNNPSPETGTSFPDKSNAVTSCGKRGLFTDGLSGLVVLAVVICAIYANVIFGGKQTFISWYDNTVQYQPWMNYVVKQWRHFTPPLWDFAADSGESFAGELQTGAFYPANILYAWTVGSAGSRALDFFLLLHILYAGLGGMLLFRKLGLGLGASIFGGAVFATVGPVAGRAVAQANIFTGLCHLPWMLYFVQRSISLQRLPQGMLQAAFAGIFLGIGLLAGHPLPFIHGSILLAAWMLVSNPAGDCGVTETLRNRWQRRAILTFTALAFAFLTGYMQLAASREYFSLADRWVGLPHPVLGLETVPYEAYTIHELKLSDWKEFLLPLNGVTDCKMPSVTVTALLLALAGLFNPRIKGARWLGLGLLIFGLVAALGDTTPAGTLFYYTPWLNKVREPVRSLLLYQAGAALLAALGLDLILRRPFFRNQSAAFAFMFAVLAVFTWEGAAAMKSALFMTADPHSGKMFNHPTDTTDFLQKAVAGSGDNYRVLVRPKELLPPNAGLLFPIHLVTGHRSSMNAGYFDYLNRDWDVKARTWDDLGARYLVTNKPVKGYAELARLNGTIIYERPNAKPVIGAEMPGTKDMIQPDSLTWKANNVTASFDSLPQGTAVVFSQPFYPDWRVSVNGHREKLLYEDIFLKVNVPAGKSVVQFYYHPRWWPLGLACWALAFAGVATLWFVARREPGQRPGV